MPELHQSFSEAPSYHRDREPRQEVAKATYQSVIPVPDVSGLAEKGLKRLTERIREAYKT